MNKLPRIMNDPDNIVDEMLKGFLKAHAGIVEATENKRVVKAKNIPADKVGVVTGGGSGHKPAFIGYVGKNLCDAAAVGEICSSPTAAAFLDGFKAADQGRGVACLYGNYSGDNTGIGVMLAANKVKGAYAANILNVYSAKRACLSNNCNIITLGSQVTGNMLAKEIIQAYLDCTYVRNERSGDKVDAYVAYEQEHFK